MPKFAHVLTNIPPGSTVTLFACGRFPQFEEVVQSGAIAFNATENAYPVRVSVRATVAGTARGGLTVLKEMAGGELVKAVTSAGKRFDLTISNVLEFNPGQERIFEVYDPRTGPWVSASQVNAPDSDATRIFTQLKCESCAVNIDVGEGRFCTKCSPRILTCEHFRLGAKDPTPCGNSLLEGYECCRQHAEYLGIYKEKRKGRPPKVRATPEVTRVKAKSPGRPKKSARVELVEDEQLALPM